jgi:integrase
LLPVQVRSAMWRCCFSIQACGSAKHLGQQHARMRTLPKMPADFVLHSLRHTFGTRLGESAADAFTIMLLMGHSTVTVSQRYVHPSPEALELAYERMTAMNLRRFPINSPQWPGAM